MKYVRDSSAISDMLHNIQRLVRDRYAISGMSHDIQTCERQFYTIRHETLPKI